MRLASIKIENFKALKSVNYEPDTLSCIVGENNAGKSSILQALVLLLNRPSSLPKDLFYDGTLPVVFTGKFIEIESQDIERLAPEHRSKLEPYVFNEELTLVARYKIDGSRSVGIMASVPKQERFNDRYIEELAKGKRGESLLAAFRQAFPEWEGKFDGATTQAAVKEIVKDIVSGFPKSEFEMSEIVLPSGISTSVDQLLPECIYIPAVKNLADDLKTTQATSFGKLLSLLMDDLTSELQAFSDSLSDLRKLLNRVEENGAVQDKRISKVKDLEGMVESFLNEQFPKAKVELVIPPPELKTVLNSAQIFVDDGSKDLIDNKGDGIKRCLTFALLRTYVRKLESHKEQKHGVRPLLFLFEEPELYLHPKLQNILFGTLGAIASTHQVVTTTHSPLFFQPGVTASFTRISKNEIFSKPVSLIHPVNFKLDLEKSETFSLAKFEHADAAFFSSKIVLLEGDSDEFFLKHVSCQLRTEWNFDLENISIVKVGGKGSFAKFKNFFESFGIGVYIICDLDTLFEGFEQLDPMKKFTKRRSKFLHELDEIIEESGLKPNSSGSTIRKKIRLPSWRERYDKFRVATESLVAGASITDEMKNDIFALGAWERADLREQAVVNIPTARDLLLPLLESLREERVAILSQGSVEDYYPAEDTSAASKPQRALEAIKKVATFKDAKQLSKPLSSDGPLSSITELEAIFQMVFGVNEVSRN